MYSTAIRAASFPRLPGRIQDAEPWLSYRRFPGLIDSILSADAEPVA